MKATFFSLVGFIALALNASAEVNCQIIPQPRLAAMSEVQWMAPQAKHYDDFLKRLEGLELSYARLGYKFCPAHE